MALRKYELALEQLKKILQIEPRFAPARELLVFCCACMGRYDEAFAEMGEVGALEATDLRSLRLRGLWGTINAMSGRHNEAREVLAQLGPLFEPPGFITAYDCAAIHATLGERDNALEYLDKARLGKFNSLFLLELRQEFACLHNDPRFQDVLRRMNLPA